MRATRYQLRIAVNLVNSVTRVLARIDEYVLYVPELFII